MFGAADSLYRANYSKFTAWLKFCGSLFCSPIIMGTARLIACLASGSRVSSERAFRSL